MDSRAEQQAKACVTVAIMKAVLKFSDGENQTAGVPSMMTTAATATNVTIRHCYMLRTLGNDRMAEQGRWPN